MRDTWRLREKKKENERHYIEKRGEKRGREKDQDSREYRCREKDRQRSERDI